MTVDESTNDQLSDQLLTIIDQILGKNGLAVSEGLTYNKMQHDYACRAAMVFTGYNPVSSQTSIGMLEGATGLGKTLGYLVPLLGYASLTNHRVGLSTHSRFLQRQILEGDLYRVQRWIETVTGSRLTAARRLGRRNYLAPSKVSALLEQLSNESGMQSTLTFVESLAEWVGAGGAVLDDFLQEHNQELPASLSASHLCLDGDSPDYDLVSYEQDLGRASSADVLIINHALLAMHAQRWGDMLEPPGSRRIAAIVVDEAHKVPAAAELVLSDAVSLSRFRRLCDSLSEDPANSSTRCRNAWANVSKQLKGLIQYLNDRTDDRHDRMVSVRHIQGLNDTLQELSQDVSKASRHLIDAMRSLDADSDFHGMALQALDDANDLIRSSSAAASLGDSSSFVSWSPIRNQPSLITGDADAGRVLGRLWTALSLKEEEGLELLPPRPRLDSILFTSATLGTPGKAPPAAFDHFSDSLGIIRHRSRKTKEPVHHVQTTLMSRYNPEEYGKMSFVLADPRVPAPSRKTNDPERESTVRTDPDWLAYSASMVAAAYRQEMRVLVLTTSWSDTAELAQQLSKIKPAPKLVVHTEGTPLREVVARYREEGGILITPAGWEGVDLPGLIPQLVIHRLPFLHPERPETLRLRRKLLDGGYARSDAHRIIWRQGIEDTVMKLHQGFGRGIRQASDTTQVWIADPRFPHPANWSSSLDPVVGSRSRRHESALRNAIPLRFLEEDFAGAKLFTRNGDLYRPEVW